MLPLKVENLSKSYSQKKVVLNGISFEVGQKQIFGLIGPNGSGKTTTLRIIATLIRPDSGNVYVYGKSAVEEPEEVRSLISYLPEEAGVYDRLTGMENLWYYAMIYSQGDTKRAKKILDYGIKLFGMEEELNRYAGLYSKGMKRRLAIARTLMAKKPLILLDEPTSGLDVFSSMEIRKTVKSFISETSSSIVFSSHNMLEVQQLCDVVALIYKGNIVELGSPVELMEKYDVENLEEVFLKAVERGKKEIEMGSQVTSQLQR